MRTSWLFLLAGSLAAPALSQVGSIAGHGGATRTAPVPHPIGFRLSGPAGSQSLTTIDLANGVESAPLLTGIELLAVDPGGRSIHDDVGVNGGRVVRIGDAQIVELPGPGAVRVVHYRRSNPNRFGFFSISGGGDFRLLVERVGVGPGATLNAFDAVVATSPDGETIAVSAADYSGGIDGHGDMWLLKAAGEPFPGGGFSRELTGLGEQEVPGSSLVFFAGRLYATLEDRLAWAPVDGSAGFTVVPVPGLVGGEVVEEFAVSADGTTLAFLAGPDEDTVDLFLLRNDLTIQRITQNPGEIQPPGYLPLDDTGPHLTLTDDGGMVAYDREIQGGHELYLQLTAPGSAPVHVTPNHLFEESIDNVSGVLTGSGLAMTFFADSGLDNADLYRATLQPGGGGVVLENLSQTSGAQTPFFPNLGKIAVSAGRTAGDARFVVDQNTASDYELWFAGGGSVLVAPGLIEAPLLASEPVTGDLVVTASAGTSGTIVSWSAGAPPSPLLALPAGAEVKELAVARGGKRVAVIADLTGASFVFSLDLATGAVADVAAGASFQGARDLAIGPAGHLLFTASDAQGAVSVAYWPVDGTVTITGPSPSARWLR